MAVAEDIRARLADCCCARKKRTRQFRRDRPCDWQATNMTDPRSGEVFTEDGAWEYVAEMIRTDIDIEVVELQAPPGKKGYVMLLPSHDQKIPIYVKLQFSADGVIGRSFHYSTTSRSVQGDQDDGK